MPSYEFNPFADTSWAFQEDVYFLNQAVTNVRRSTRSYLLMVRMCLAMLQSSTAAMLQQ